MTVNHGCDADQRVEPMKTLKGRCGRLAAVVVGLAAAGSMQAGLSLLDIAYYNNYPVTVHEATKGNVSTLATAFQATRTGGDPLPAAHSNPFTTFCIDLRYELAEPAKWLSGSFPNPNGGTPPIWQVDGIYRAASLYNTYAGGVNFTTVAGKEEGAALQLAIWEVLYEPAANGFNVNSGAGFYVVSGANTTIKNRANALLGSAANQVDYNLTTTFWDAKTKANGDPLLNNQDLIGPFMAVPEPGTFVAAALVLLPLLAGWMRRGLARAQIA